MELEEDENLGSLKELIKVAFPLMISSLAWLFMIFVDRCFLAKYSTSSLNSATSAGTLAWGFIGGLGILTGLCSIYVAQYNGSKQYDKIGAPVWQMIWLALERKWR